MNYFYFSAGSKDHSCRSKITQTCVGCIEDEKHPALKGNTSLLKLTMHINYTAATGIHLSRLKDSFLVSVESNTFSFLNVHISA